MLWQNVQGLGKKISLFLNTTEMRVYCQKEMIMGDNKEFPEEDDYSFFEVVCNRRDSKS